MIDDRIRTICDSGTYSGVDGDSCGRSQGHTHSDLDMSIARECRAPIMLLL
jgi:hypothetical protein